jgi:uncharacterized protein YqeY
MRVRITNALKTAMLDKEKLRTSTLRLIIAALKEREIAARGTDDAAELDDASIVAILSKMVKQREESAKAYDDAAREDLAKQERSEIKIIREFMPKPLSEEESDAAVKAAIKNTGASSIRDMGKVMGVLKAKYNGQMDFIKVGAAIKSKLA